MCLFHAFVLMKVHTNLHLHGCVHNTVCVGVFVGEGGAFYHYP
jgi:hypothetical protein